MQGLVRTEFWRRAEEGAVFAEFLLAFVVLLTLFFCTAELALLSTANLLVRHAAMVAVRASAVISQPNPNTQTPPQAFDFEAYDPLTKGMIFYEPKDKRDKAFCDANWAKEPDLCSLTKWNQEDLAIRADAPSRAARGALAPWYPRRFDGPSVSCALDPPMKADAEETCRVIVHYRCLLPIAKLVLCPGGSRKLQASASFPHQGAYYKPEFGF
jgi:Flp pilus assembly protein TadG